MGVRETFKKSVIILLTMDGEAVRGYPLLLGRVIIS
jgi:hypothetical protein